MNLDKKRYMYPETENKSNFSSIMQYGHIFLKWLWLMVFVALLTGYGAFYYSDLQPRVYQASTVVVVNMPSGVSDIDTTTQSMVLTSTYSKTMITKELLQATAKKMGVPVTGSVSASGDIDTPTITISVRDRDSQKAADTANAVAVVFIEQIDTRQSERYTELEASIEEEIARIDLELVSINEKLANLEPVNTETGTGSGQNPASENNTENVVLRSQLELSLSQYTQTRYSLVYNLHKRKQH